MIIELIKGLLLGTAVSAFNYFITLRALENWGEIGSRKAKAKGRTSLVFLVRYSLNFAALFLVYKNVPMLIGTGIGLTMVKNILFFKYLIKRKR
jgi:hypothetical protein